MIRRPPRSTLFPTRRSSDLLVRALGHTVEEAVDGEDAVQKLASAQYDVLLTDVQMPRMDGFQLDRKSTRLNSSHLVISYAVFCLKKKNNFDDSCNSAAICRV